MRIISRGALCALLVLAFSVAAQNSGPASNGDFQFALDGATGAIQYNARQQGSSATGQMTFTGAIDISNEDVDGEGTGGNAVSNVTVTVSIDCLRINGNRAAMSGLVSSASEPAYVGVRAVLAVEDNGEGSKAPALDRFTWGLYRPTATGWMPSDAEVPGDNGAMFTWFATDAEREDDVPIQAGLSTIPTSVDCKTFPFGSYAFENVAHGAGNIQVKP